MYVVADTYGHTPRGPTRLVAATRWSLQGIRAAWLYESSFRLEACLASVLVPLGAWIGRSGVERSLLVGSVTLVLAIELLNSAVEAVIERYGAEHHELAGRAKDMGSGAVFVCVLIAVATWMFILFDR